MPHEIDLEQLRLPADWRQIIQPPRGTIHSRARAEQLRDFSGLRWGTITPTDIDLFLDFRNYLFVFGEAKHNTTELPKGQRIALERLCDATRKSGRVAMALICSHNTDPSQPIPMADAIVTEYRHLGQWKDDRAGFTVKALIDEFLVCAFTAEDLDRICREDRARF